MVYITGHTFTNRLTNFITAKIYANCDSVELFVNGNSRGTRASTNCIFTWPVSLQSGSNTVVAVGSKTGTQVTDSLVWIAPTPSRRTAPVSDESTEYRIENDGKKHDEQSEKPVHGAGPT